MTLNAKCLSASGADILSPMGALTCADGSSFFIQGYNGSTYQLMEVTFNSAGVASENWRATSLASSGSTYYHRLTAGENYLYGQNQLSDAEFFVIDKTDGSLVASRDFAGLEIGTYKQTDQGTAFCDLVVIGDCAYFVSLWYTDKTSTTPTSSVEWGYHVVNASDLTDLDASDYAAGSKKIFSLSYPSFKKWNLADTSTTNPGRLAAAYKMSNNDYVIAFWAFGIEAGTSTLSNPLRHKMVEYTLNSHTDPVGTDPTLSTSQIRDADQSAYEISPFWAPCVSSDLLYLTNVTGGQYSPLYSYYLTAGDKKRMRLGANYLALAATDGNAWICRENSSSGLMDDYGYAGQVELGSSTRVRNSGDEVHLVTTDSSGKAYAMDYDVGYRLNDVNDPSDKTSLDFTGLTGITSIRNRYGQAICNRAGSGYHDTNAGVW